MKNSNKNVNVTKKIKKLEVVFSRFSCCHKPKMKTLFRINGPDSTHPGPGKSLI